jgi:hypothetical protein
MAFVVVTGEKEENESIVASSCYYVDEATRLADVAYMIRPEWQCLGVGSILQEKMVEYAKARGAAPMKSLHCSMETPRGEVAS